MTSLGWRSMCSFENATAAKHVRMAATAILLAIRSESFECANASDIICAGSAVLNSLAIFGITTIVTET
jgi:hypothetical protein